MFSKLKWRDFKTDPPYDYRSNSSLEDDPDRAYFTFRYVHKPHLSKKENKFLSYTACQFIDGIFAEYKSHMKTSPYKEDWIEVLTWCPITEIHEALLKSSGAKYV